MAIELGLFTLARTFELFSTLELKLFRFSQPSNSRLTNRRERGAGRDHVLIDHHLDQSTLFAVHRRLESRFKLISAGNTHARIAISLRQLREAGYRTDFPLAAAKVGKQFQTAEQLGSRFSVLVGDEWPQVKVKVLATREEVLVPHDALAAHLSR